jgi:hypothetical protein
MTHEEANALLDLFERRWTDGEIEYLMVGGLIAAVPKEQIDGWNKIVAQSEAASKLLTEEGEGDG